MKSIGCLLLAGGKGSRMDCRNKFELSYKGDTFGNILAIELRKLGLPCFLSVGEYEQKIPEGFLPVKDEVPEAGPIGGICSGLRKAKEEGLSGLYVLSCDMPLFKKEVFETIREDAETYELVFWRTKDGKEHYATGYYDVSLLPELEKKIAERHYRLWDLKKASNSRIRETDSRIPDRLFLNINDSMDYEKLNRGES